MQGQGAWGGGMSANQLEISAGGRIGWWMAGALHVLGIPTEQTSRPSTCFCFILGHRCPPQIPPKVGWRVVMCTSHPSATSILPNVPCELVNFWQHAIISPIPFQQSVQHEGDDADNSRFSQSTLCFCLSFIPPSHTPVSPLPACRPQQHERCSGSSSLRPPPSIPPPRPQAIMSDIKQKECKFGSLTSAPTSRYRTSCARQSSERTLPPLIPSPSR
jgi:hypothetical protein